MRNTKRFFISLFIAIFTMSMLAGCGGTTAATSGTTAATESKDKEPVVIDSNGEGAVQGGIKSDEEIAALQEEEAAFAAESEAAESNQPAEFEDNSGHEPEAYGSGNFQDYWEGEDYFDLEGYLRDIGCDDYYGMVLKDSVLVQAEDGEEPINYTAWYKNWRIGICQLTYCTANYNGEHEPFITVYADYALESHKVTVNQYGTTITEGVLQTLDAMINAINANPNSANPFEQLNANVQ